MKNLFSKLCLAAGLFAGGIVALVLATFFPASLRAVLSADGFMPHVHCYLDNPRMVALHVISDMLIGLAYVSIPCTLVYLVIKARGGIPFHWMFVAFGIFIISCGFTHFMEVLTVWHAYYWMAGVVKAITAVASIVTAIALVPLVPKVIRLIDAVRVSEERRLKLIAANRELEAFAYTISHDLRAPLRTMQGMALALEQDFAPSMQPTAQTYTKKIVSASERMDRLILDLLEYSRLGLSHFEVIPTQPRIVLEEVVASLAANVTERNAVIRIDGEFPAVMANRSLLTLALANLLTNAIKFVPKDRRPEVTVQAETRGSKLRICISDNGIGIAPEHQQRIFKIFERLHAASEYPGTGVGLAIVQRASEQMGGEVGVKSEAGKGSCFWIELKTA